MINSRLLVSESNALSLNQDFFGLWQENKLYMYGFSRPQAPI